MPASMSFILCSLCLLLLTSCSFAKPEAGDPAPDHSGPVNLTQALEHLDAMLSESDKEKIRGGTISPVSLHMSLGMRLRNELGLWTGSALAKHFNDLGIMDPDAMSAIVLETYIRSATGKPLDIDKQIRIHKAHWDSQQDMRDRRAKYEAGEIDSVRSESDK
jgi:hypothetical protein